MKTVDPDQMASFRSQLIWFYTIFKRWQAMCTECLSNQIFVEKSALQLKLQGHCSKSLPCVSTCIEILTSLEILLAG